MSGERPADLIDRLERLSRLRDSGALDEEEYRSAKAQLLSRAAPTASRPAPVPAARPGPADVPAQWSGLPSWLPWALGAVLLVIMVVVGAVLVGRDAAGDGNRMNGGQAGVPQAGNDAAPLDVPSTEPTPEASAMPAPDPVAAPPRVTVDGGVLLVDGQPTRPELRGDNGLAIAGTYHLGDRTLYLVEDEGGTACPATYHVVDVSAGARRVTPAFGTCAAMGQARLSGDALVVGMAGFAGPEEPDDEQEAATAERHVFRYREGQVREDRTNRAPTGNWRADTAD